MTTPSDQRNTTPAFGTRAADIEYRVRPGAYAIIHDTRGRVAVLDTSSGTHLPGGGSEPGETLQETLEREVLEECGWAVSGLTHIGDAIQYLHAPGEGHFAKVCTYYAVAVVEPCMPAADNDHSIRWLESARVEQELSHESHRWALKQWQDLAFPGQCGPPTS